MRKIKYIVLHTAASSRGGRAVHASFEAVRNYHVQTRGWTDIGYHAYVDQIGEIYDGRPRPTPGAHVSTFNTQTLGLCVSGHGDLEKWNAAQLAAVIEWCAATCAQYGLGADAIVGHHECEHLPEYEGPPISKTCPGVLIDLDAIRDQVRKASSRVTLEERVARIEAYLQL